MRSDIVAVFLLLASPGIAQKACDLTREHRGSCNGEGACQAKDGAAGNHHHCQGGVRGTPCFFDSITFVGLCNEDGQCCVRHAKWCQHTFECVRV